MITPYRHKCGLLKKHCPDDYKNVSFIGVGFMYGVLTRTLS